MRFRVRRRVGIAWGMAVFAGAAVLLGVVLWHVATSNHGRSEIAGPAGQAGGMPTYKPGDASEAGKYLVIQEWGVRVALPDNLRGKVIYKLGASVRDPDGIWLQNAKIYLSVNAAKEHCIEEQSSIGAVSMTGVQYIRAASAMKQLNTGRYSGTFKGSILRSGDYTFHLNYVTPDCMDVPEVAELQQTLPALQPIPK